MKAKEIIESGLLELYVLGLLENEELSMIEAAISKYATVRKELREIESAMAKYASAHKVPVGEGVLEKTIGQLSGKPERTLDNSSAPKSMWNALSIASGIAACLLLFYAYNLKQQNTDLQAQYDASVADCDEIRKVYDNQSNLFAALTDQDNLPIEIAATEKYPETRLIIHTNAAQSQNYLQIQNLPDIADGYSFQLWSLKADTAPIPLDVFNAGQDILLPVEFVENSNAYAITIEVSGGATTPNLDELIGVFTVS